MNSEKQERNQLFQGLYNGFKDKINEVSENLAKVQTLLQTEEK
jgi:hypothetical protein